MKKYKVTVNGHAYEVEIELIDESGVHATVSNPAPVQCSEEVNVVSPMPGTILNVKVSAGQHVKKGDILFVLEAMKMENEIMADRDATVHSVCVDKGAAVESGAILCTLK